MSHQKPRTKPLSLQFRKLEQNKIKTKIKMSYQKPGTKPLSLQFRKLVNEFEKKN
jgi:hypothetical protein